MHPILIKIGPFTIHMYGFMLALGVLAAIGLSTWLAKKNGLDHKLLADFYFFTILLGLLGAKIFLFVTELDYYLEVPSRMKDLLTSGGTFYGGLIFGALFAAWFIRKHNLNFRKMGDIIGPAIALAHFFGRMGCFFAGCCWGRDAHGCPIGVEFTNPQATTGVPQHQSLFPTQLTEAILNLMNFALLMVFLKKKKFDGQIFVMYIFNYSLIRFFMEYFRGDDDRGYIFGGYDHSFTSFSVPQLISVIGVIVAFVLYKNFKKKGDTPLPTK
ncbi:MAG: prolipoprotein diacylglyceryl transferase [bacterium]|nr:prolipoprotein diacylglyceryl transferase [bacterium]